MNGQLLISLAKNAIAQKLNIKITPIHYTDKELAELRQTGASFVTLTQNGDLRGCIGTLEAFRPLKEDIEANALASAFRDPRFPPLEAAEWPYTQVEISILSAPKAIEFQNEIDLFQQIKPEVDGIILSLGERRATFLPQVWEQLPTHREFFARLKQKAGLPIDFPVERLHIEKYQVQKYTTARGDV